MKGQIMDGSIQIYYGTGRGKTTAALGLGIRAAAEGKQVIMVQFLKGKNNHTLEYLKKLEPELQIFRFERAGCVFSELSPEEQKEQVANIQTALSYTKKVLDTCQCDVLILDEIFGLIDYGIITVEELYNLVSIKNDSMDVIMTGRKMPDIFMNLADCIYNITAEKENDREILE